MGAESTSLCMWVKHLPNLLRNKANSQKHSSFYEDRRPKVQRTLRKQKVRGLLKDKKVPGTSRGDQGGCSPRPAPDGLLQDSWEKAELMAPSPAKQGFSSTKRDLVA